MPEEVDLRAALAGDRQAVRAFVANMSPVISARVMRALARRSGTSGRDARQEVTDITQDVFAALFAHDGRVLRAWEPGRGLSLANFVGLVAERQAASILRSGRRSPWRDIPEDIDTIEPSTVPVPDAAPQIESRAMLERLLERLETALSPRGLVLFQRLYVEEEAIEDVATSMGMTREAIYAWRNRVTKHLQQFAREMNEEALDPGSPPRKPPRKPEADE